MDRLAELGAAPAAIDVPAAPMDAAPADGAGGAPKPPEEGLPIELCMKVTAEIQTGTNEIRSLTVQLRAQLAEQQRTFSPDTNEDGSQAISSTMELVQAQIKLCKKKLDELKQATTFLGKTPEDAANNAATIKIYENQHQHLGRAFLQAVTEFKAVQQEKERLIKEQTVRRIKMKYTNSDGSTISDDDANKMAKDILENDEPDALFQQSRDTLNMILENREDLKRIERSARELQQMFNDLAVILSEQGEVMDQIKTNVENSIKYVEKGREELKSAKKYQKSSRKKMCFVIIAVFVLFLVILAPTLGATVPTIKK